MSTTFDIVVRGGTVVDGSGAEPFEADVGMKDGRIAAVGPKLAGGEEEIEAKGRIVTPGFVDIHTHYDGHATWAKRLEPSSSHGVTTVVMGNCGVGFAPCHPGDRGRLIRLMEGVEDIPEPVMTAGLPWTWESFRDYLNYLEGREFDIDLAAQLPHAPLRVFVMGERAAAKAPATEDDIAHMRAIAADAMRAGALGFSTSRTLNHRASDGELTPSYAAASDELTGIAQGLKDAGTGVLQLISDFDDIEREFAIVRRMASTSGRPLSLSLMQNPAVPTKWREILDRIEQANRDGLTVKAQVAGRPIGLIYGLSTSRNPFTNCPSYQAIADLGVKDRAIAMRDTARRAAILAEYPGEGYALPFEMMYLMGDEPRYEPVPEESIASEAARRGIHAKTHAYDLLSEDQGLALFYIPVMNYAGSSNTAMHTMLKHEHSILGLGDGGAHCAMICDASMTTHMMIRWARGGTGSGLSLASVVHALTASTATAVGLDRGLVAAGAKADLNVIDLDHLVLHRPKMVHDLPEGGGRLSQRASGYDATIVSGRITYRQGEFTGNLPGRLVRSAHAKEPN